MPMGRRRGKRRQKGRKRERRKDGGAGRALGESGIYWGASTGQMSVAPAVRSGGTGL